MATLEQLEQFEKLKAEYAGRNRRAELFPELVAALETINDICMTNPQEVRRLSRVTLIKAKEA